MRTLIAFVHQRFEGDIGILLVEQEPVDIRDRYIRRHVAQDFPTRFEWRSAPSSERNGCCRGHR
jgi:hypothetical protein